MDDGGYHLKKLKLPYYPEETDAEVWQNYQIYTSTPRMIAEYAGMSIPAVLELDLVDYLILRRDAYISMLTRSKAGREYLEKAWCREQTEPDRSALRKLIAGGGARGLQ